jgi:hypothetical protein
MSNVPLVLTNQFGEVSINQVSGADDSTYFPLPGPGNIIIMNGASTPVDGTTGDNIAGKGSLYMARDTGALYVQTGAITSPVWEVTGTTTNAAIIAAVLTAFSAGAGTITAADTILGALQKLTGNTQNLTVIGNLLTGFSAAAGIVASTDSILAALQKVAPVMNGTLYTGGANAETVSTATAISTTKLLTNLSNSTGGDLAATLAAPSSQDGQIKILKMTVRTSNNFTLAMTNIAMSGAYTPTGTTTLTFGAVGQTAILIAVGSKWVYLGGSAVAS